MSPLVSKVVTREYQPGDEEQIVAVFNKAFGRVDPNFQPRSLERWRWQYRENPSGWRIILAFTPEGRLICQFAGIGQRSWLDGQPAQFSQAVDSMVDPDFGGGLKKPGYFGSVINPYHKYGGPPPDRDTIYWGLPIPAAWRIGKAFLGYRMVRMQLKLAAPPSAVRPGSGEGVQIEEVGRFPEELDGLDRRLGETYGAIAVRDREQMNWRFPDHPDHRYAIALARRDGELLGYAVYRTGSFDGRDGEGLVCDWALPPGEDRAAAALLAWLAGRAGDEGAERLVFLLPDTAPQWVPLQEAGFRVERTRYLLAAHSFWKKRYRLRWFYRNWYYSLGDTDLV